MARNPRLFSANWSVVVSAPGRICLFGEHQDYLGLPVIAAAIDLRIRVEARRRQDSAFCILLPDVGAEDMFVPHAELEYRGKRDYLRAAVNVLCRQGVRFDQGWDVRVAGRIPICAGCSSSSALLVAWVEFLLTVAGLEKTAEQVAEMAYEAEVVEFGEPGGMMDHYTASLGGILHIKTTPPITPTPLRARPTGFVLGDTLQKKDTVGTLGELRREAQAGLQLIRGNLPCCTFDTLYCAALPGREALGRGAAAWPRPVPERGVPRRGGAWRRLELRCRRDDHLLRRRRSQACL